MMETFHCTVLYLPHLCVSVTLYDQSPLFDDRPQAERRADGGRFVYVGQ